MRRGTRAFGEDPAVPPPDVPDVAQALRWSIERLRELVPSNEFPAESPVAWGASATLAPATYRYWLEEREALDGRDGAGEVASGPSISVIVPVFRPEIWYFVDCVSSIVGQTYDDWELCLCDDGSQDERLSRVLEELAASDPRIKLTVHERNGGISRASNSALALAGGDWVALVDHDDLIEPDALAEVARAIVETPAADIVYTDDDRMDEQGRRYDPYFKPDWSPDLLLSQPYMGHMTVLRRTLLEAIGGFRPEFDGSQDFDVMLRASERARSVAHVPKVLYHWRAVSGSAASDSGAKPWAHRASKRAVEDAVRRRGIDGVVESTPYAGTYHLRWRITGSPTVAVIIPFRDQAALTAGCLSAITASPGYDRYEIILVDNASTEPETRVLVEQARRQGARVLTYPGPFNWSAINNRAARSCEADFLLFMNNDIDAPSEGWLHALVEQCQRPEVGAVGARLVFPNGRVQHAGIVLGSASIAGHIFAGMPGGELGYSLWDRVVRPYSAVTGACLLTKRGLFEDLGGFDEHLHAAYNDVDYCMRLQDAGYRVLYTPHARFVHHESVSRGLSGFLGDVRYFLAKWERARLRSDPFYNQNLGRFESWCPLRRPDEDERWEKVLDDLIGT